MDSTTSLSKGCFAFVPKSSKVKKKKRSSQKDEFEDFYSIPQVSVYSSVINCIEEKLKTINNNASDEVLQDLVKFISSCPNADFAIPTAVLLTGINLPDHRVLFQAFADRLRDEVTPHVSVLLSSECSTVKNTIEQLTSQFLRCSTASLDPQVELEDSDSEEEDVFDEVKRSQCTMPNLVTWYEKQTKLTTSPKKRKTRSSTGKLVVVIPDFEGFSTKVLQDVILILSGYLDRLPLVLVFGVATSVKALQSSLPHRITSRMDVRMFQSRQSVHFLNSTINEVFLSWKKPSICPFLLGPKMFKFLTDVFIFYDFSVHGFIQGVKYCLMEHFYNNPLSKLCCPREQLPQAIKELDKEDLSYVEENQEFRSYLEKLPKSKLEQILQSDKPFKDTILTLMEDLQDHKDNLLVAVWLLHSLIHDLPEAPLGKQVREIYIEVMSGPIVQHPKFENCFKLLNLMSKQELLQKIDEMNQILEESECLTEVQDELMDLRRGIESAGQNMRSPTKSPTKNRAITMCKDRKGLREQLLTPNVRIENEFEQARSKLLNYLRKNVFQKYLVSPSSLPLHEVFLIDNVSTKRHIVGAPRAAIHTALHNPHHYLQCDCCKMSSDGEILHTMPDVCIVYKLHLESGALINMYDWLQSFVTIVSPEDSDRDDRKVDPGLQARFTRAVSELQFLGFVKASKKKTDHVARLTWGRTC
ncbi:origin recognition complex subunit 3 [Homalodisca vitripennis]|uniref:origin recognition complex subunit 3 n=1 Tax=Homalodisca vitripennis TaxID=197043 RepID=UPI001EE9F0DE|nr:origin recognition complex subunit 3 [Homalodisca vitripennis]